MTRIVVHANIAKDPRHSKVVVVSQEAVAAASVLAQAGIQPVYGKEEDSLDVFVLQGQTIGGLVEAIQELFGMGRVGVSSQAGVASFRSERLELPAAPRSSEAPPIHDEETMTTIMVIELGRDGRQERPDIPLGRLTYKTTASPEEVANVLRARHMAFSYGESSHHINITVSTGDASHVHTGMRRLFPPAR